ncbi:MAG: hypothetical protein ABI224_08220 [Acetobacteraceae bacterium]
MRLILRGHAVQTAYRVGWAELSNGELLRAAERDGFEVFVTCDQNIEHQKSLSGYSLAIVVLNTTHWPTMRANPQPVREAVERTAPGRYAVVTLPRPRLHRRAPPPRDMAE